MIIRSNINSKNYEADLNCPLDISLPIKNGANNPSCYYASDVSFSVIKSGDFIGSVAQGGTVNYQELKMTPHGNGTHTETYGHLTADEGATISQLIKSIHCTAQLITLEPRQIGEDLVIHVDDFLSRVKYDTEAVIIRTSPNQPSKCTKQYSGTNPPYIDPEIGHFLNKNNVQHLLVDLPSVDKEVDGGKLLTHRAFWGLPNEVRKESTITELIFVDNDIVDGFYLLNLQVLNIQMDASPSRPVLFKFKEC